MVLGARFRGGLGWGGAAVPGGRCREGREGRHEEQPLDDETDDAEWFTPGARVVGVAGQPWPSRQDVSDERPEGDAGREQPDRSVRSDEKQPRGDKTSNFEENIPDLHIAGRLAEGEPVLVLQMDNGDHHAQCGSETWAVLPSPR